MFTKIIKISFITILLFSALALSTNPIQAQTPTNTFACFYEDGTEECYAPYSTGYYDCDSGFGIIEGYCEAYNGDRGNCLSQANIDCVEFYPEAGYNCISIGECQPCFDDQCSYGDYQTCMDACTGDTTYDWFRCDSEDGCVPDSSCTDSNPSCYDGAIACESSDCAVDTGYIDPNAPSTLAAYKLCSQAGDKYNKCNSCLNANGIWTAFGCIPFTPKSLIEKILPIAVGVAGAISLLIMLMGVLFITTSSGNPDNLQKGKEIITAAITGLLFIIFSIVLLNLIGVEILQIPGF